MSTNNPIVQAPDRGPMYGHVFMAGLAYYRVSRVAFAVHTGMKTGSVKGFEKLSNGSLNSVPVWADWVFAGYERYPDLSEQAGVLVPYREWGIAKEANEPITGPDVQAALNHYGITIEVFGKHIGKKRFGIMNIIDDPGPQKNWVKRVLYIYDKHPESRTITNRIALPIDRWLKDFVSDDVRIDLDTIIL